MYYTVIIIYVCGRVGWHGLVQAPEFLGLWINRTERFLGKRRGASEKHHGTIIESSNHRQQKKGTILHCRALFLALSRKWWLIDARADYVLFTLSITFPKKFKEDSSVPCTSIANRSVVQDQTLQNGAQHCHPTEEIYWRRRCFFKLSNIWFIWFDSSNQPIWLLISMIWTHVTAGTALTAFWVPLAKDGSPKCGMKPWHPMMCPTMSD